MHKINDSIQKPDSTQNECNAHEILTIVRRLVKNFIIDDKYRTLKADSVPEISS